MALRISTLAALLLAAMLAGCGDDTTARDPAADAAATADAETLPRPEGTARGGVTGMPDEPGPGRVGPPAPPDGVLPADTTVANELLPLQPGDAFATDPALVDPSAAAPSPTVPSADQAATAGVAPAVREPSAPAPVVPGEPPPEAAVAVVQAYYAAINAGQYARAHSLWSGDGSASGQTLQQFAHGFADTASVRVEAMEPGRVGAAAGSRYIEVPVAITGTRDDGSVRKYVGVYTLRRAVVDGASAEQRAWRIAAADIREVQP